MHTHREKLEKVFKNERTGKPNIVAKSIVQKLFCRCDAIPTEIAIGFVFLEVDELVLKGIRKSKGPRTAGQPWKNEGGGLPLPETTLITLR